VLAPTVERVQPWEIGRLPGRLRCDAATRLSLFRFAQLRVTSILRGCS